MKLYTLCLLISTISCTDQDFSDLDDVNFEETPTTSTESCKEHKIAKKAQEVKNTIKRNAVNLKSKANTLLEKVKKTTTKTAAGFSIAKQYFDGFIKTGKEMANNGVKVLQKITGDSKQKEIIDEDEDEDLDLD